MKLRRIAERFAAPIIILLLVFQAVAHAASDNSVPAGKWAKLTLDPAQTTIAFTLIGWPHITNGAFKLKRGMIRVDPASGKMDGEIVVDAASGNSGHSIRDSRMKNSILEVDRFPDIIFTPRQVVSHGAPPGEFPAIVRGVMTLHGDPHPFTITASVRRGGDLVTLHCEFKIPFVAWGLEDPSIMFFKVQKEVDVQVTAVGSLTWVAP